MKKLIRSNCHFTLSILLVFAIGYLANAQPGGYRISDYKNPVYRYQMLETVFDLSSGLTHQGNQNHSDSIWNKSDYASLNMNFDLYYSRYVNSPKYQGDQYASVNFHSRFNSSNSTLGQISALAGTNLDEGISFGSNNRFYFRSLWYYEVSPSAGLSFISSSSDSRYLANINQQELNIRNLEQQLSSRLSVKLGTGRGRIEAVQDAALASYILEDLSKIDGIQAVQSPEQVKELAELITRLKTSRYFDSRLRKIVEITAIDSLLQSAGLKKKENAAYFTTLYDNWLYANNPQRLNGFRFYIALTPDFRFSRMITEQDTTDPEGGSNKLEVSVLSPGFEGILGYEYARAVNLKWQRSANIELRYIHNIRELNSEQLQQMILIDNATIEYTEKYLYSQLRFTNGYYPNTRTWMTLSLSSNFSYTTSDRDETNADSYTGQTSLAFALSANFSAYYYISERLRLEGNFRAYTSNHNYNSGNHFDPDLSDKNDKSRRITGSVSGKLSYSIF